MIVSFSWIVDCLYAFSARFSPYGVAFSCYFVNAIFLRRVAVGGSCV